MIRTTSLSIQKYNEVVNLTIIRNHVVFEKIQLPIVSSSNQNIKFHIAVHLNIKFKSKQIKNQTKVGLSLLILSWFDAIREQLTTICINFCGSSQIY